MDYNLIDMGKIITLPGLIDPHVHLRDPGHTHKEDFLSGTSAALAGGFTTVLDMPNNKRPITSEKLLDLKILSAQKQVVCDIGFFFGSLGDNFDEFPKVVDKVKGLKIYLNVTTGNFKIDKSKLIEIYKAWPSDKPILLHAEADVLDIVLQTIREVPKKTHICHVSSRKELEFVINAKSEGLPVTCGVTPHHLYLTDRDELALGGFADVKPHLKTKADQKYLWDNLDVIDLVESDHAPHLFGEKAGETAHFGMPGLETTLPLMLTAVEQGKLTHNRMIEMLHTNSAKIFNIASDPKTSVEVEMIEHIIDDEDLQTKAGWAPYSGSRVLGKVRSVKLRGKLVYDQGAIICNPGTGKILS